MTEEARKSTGNGDEKKGAVGVKTKVKYSDNILPIVSKNMIYTKKMLNFFYVFLGEDQENNENGSTNYRWY